jgi:hypothetical protein
MTRMQVWALLISCTVHDLKEQVQDAVARMDKDQKIGPRPAGSDHPWFTDGADIPFIVEAREPC